MCGQGAGCVARAAVVMGVASVGARAAEGGVEVASAMYVFNAAISPTITRNFALQPAP